MNIRSFNIPAPNTRDVDAKLLKLNKRAVKLGLPEIIWTWGKAFLNGDKLIVPIELSGPLQVQYNDWEFVATLQHLSTGENILRAIKNISIPKEFRESGSRCQHCLINRYRRDTYLVRNLKDNTWFQVGSSCIKDFLGGLSPDSILQQAELISGLMEYMEGSSQQGHSSEDLYHIITFLAQTNACIRDHGWVSKSRAQETNQTATVFLVIENFHPSIGLSKSLPTEQDHQQAMSAADWAENLSDIECDKSDYLYNIRAIARSGMVGYRTMGFAASILPAYQRALDAVKPKLISNYVGSVKERLTFCLFLKQELLFSGSYGTVFKYIFEDKDGNKFVWSSSNRHYLVKDVQYSIKGTIKAHSEYKGVKQTILTRCQVLN